MQLDEVVATLVRISSYDDDWDGNGSVAPSRTVILRAQRMAMLLDRTGNVMPVRVVATVNGNICFEFADHLPIEITEHTPCRLSRRLSGPR